MANWSSRITSSLRLLFLVLLELTATRAVLLEPNATRADTQIFSVAGQEVKVPCFAFKASVDFDHVYWILNDTLLQLESCPGMKLDHDNGDLVFIATMSMNSSIFQCMALLSDGIIMRFRTQLIVEGTEKGH